MAYPTHTRQRLRRRIRRRLARQPPQKSVGFDARSVARAAVLSYSLGVCSFGSGAAEALLAYPWMCMLHINHQPRHLRGTRGWRLKHATTDFASGRYRQRTFAVHRSAAKKWRQACTPPVERLFRDRSRGCKFRYQIGEARACPPPRGALWVPSSSAARRQALGIGSCVVYLSFTVCRYFMYSLEMLGHSCTFAICASGEIGGGPAR